MTLVFLGNSVILVSIALPGLVSVVPEFRSFPSSSFPSQEAGCSRQRRRHGKPGQIGRRPAQLRIACERCFEACGHREHGGVAATPTDDLQAERQPGFIEAERNADGGMAGKRDGISERQPMEVRFRWYPVDLRGMRLRPRPRTERDGRADQHVAAFEEALPGAIDPRLRRCGARMVFERVAEAFLDIGGTLGPSISGRSL